MIGLSKSRGALSMENQKMPEYETIRAAVAGEKWAVEKVVDCYKDEIDRLSTVAVRPARRKHETGNQRRYAPVYHKEADRSPPAVPA